MSRSSLLAILSLLLIVGCGKAPPTEPAEAPKATLAAAPTAPVVAQQPAPVEPPIVIPKLEPEPVKPVVREPEDEDAALVAKWKARAGTAKAELEKERASHEARHARELELAAEQVKIVTDEMELAKKGSIVLNAKTEIRTMGGKRFYVFGSIKARAAKVDELRAAENKRLGEIESLKIKHRDLMAQYAETAELLEKSGIYPPRIAIDALAVGDAGYLAAPGGSRAPLVMEIFQIVDKDNMLIRHKLSGDLFWLKMPTDGLVDGKSFTPRLPYKVTGTRRYATANGASKTVFVLAKVKMPEG